MNQAIKFAQWLLKGEQDRVPIVKDVVVDILKDVLRAKVRQVV